MKWNKKKGRQPKLRTRRKLATFGWTQPMFSYGSKGWHFAVKKNTQKEGPLSVFIIIIFLSYQNTIHLSSIKIA